MLGQTVRKESYSSVVERELEVMYRVARRMTLSDADAEDIVGQTLMVAYRNWEQFDGRHPRSWLLRILRNEWLQILRKRNVRPETNLDDLAEPADQDFWKAVDAKLQAEQILVALDGLPEDFRIVVVLCDVEQMSYDDAAKTLDIPVGTIRSRLFRARKMLRSKLIALTE